MLTNEHILKLLRACSGYDGRRPPTDQQKAAWMEGGKRGRWTFAEAEEAIHDHYAEHTEWIMPGHVTAIIRRKRKILADTEADLAERQRAAGVSTAGRDRVRAMISELAIRLGIPSDPDHDEARRMIQCPHCRAMPGERCRNRQSGKPLRESPGHQARIDALIASKSAR
jgi:hypothetical protein